MDDELRRRKSIICKPIGIICFCCEVLFLQIKAEREREREKIISSRCRCRRLRRFIFCQTISTEYVCVYVCLRVRINLFNKPTQTHIHIFTRHSEMKCILHTNNI